MGSVNFLKIFLLGVAAFCIVAFISILTHPENALGTNMSIYLMGGLVVTLAVFFLIPSLRGMFIAELLELGVILGMGALAVFVVIKPQIIATVKKEIPTQVVPPDSGEDGGKKVTPTPPDGGEAKTTTPEPEEEQPLSAERLRALGITTDE
jgi:hypothetical protein